MFALSELVDSDDSGARPAIGLAAGCHGRLSRRNVWGRMLLQGRGVVDQVQVQLEIEGGCTGQMTRAASWRKWTLCFAALLLLNQPHWRCSREAFFCPGRSKLLGPSWGGGKWQAGTGCIKD